MLLVLDRASSGSSLSRDIRLNSSLLAPSGIAFTYEVVGLVQHLLLTYRRWTYCHFVYNSALWLQLGSSLNGSYCYDTESWKLGIFVSTRRITMIKPCKRRTSPLYNIRFATIANTLLLAPFLLLFRITTTAYTPPSPYFRFSHWVSTLSNCTLWAQAHQLAIIINKPDTSDRVSVSQLI